MKREFEGIVFENRRIGDNAVGACTTEEFEEFYQCLPIGKHVHITVEELPESKPEKNCGNCDLDRNKCTEHERKYGCDAWQLKATEVKAEGWEQRFDSEFSADFYAIATKHMDNARAFIRAEIERVHAGYAPLISTIEMAFKEADFLPEGRLTRKARVVFEPIRSALAEQNKHREGEK